MQAVRVELGDRSYDIVVGAGALESLGVRISGLGLKGRALIVTNPTINRLYGARVRALIEAAGLRAETFEFPEGEEHKQIATVMTAYDHLIEHSYSRASVIVALGGGVVGDMAGFVAATYMRGIEFIQIPTTLLAMVDSSVGGKTGVNHRLAKNMIGAFHQPRLVIADLDTLRTLPPREFRTGYAEVVKTAAIWDAELFQYLEAHWEAVFALAPEPLGRVVSRCCQIKAEVVSLDERESNVRAILNFGHTFAHALEAVTDYAALNHGEAVAIGMVAAARTAERLHMLPAADTRRIERHLEHAGLHTRFPPVDVEAVLARFRKDKKATEGAVRFVLPDRIGHVVVRDDVEPSLVRQVIEEMVLPSA